ncbi:MAG: hypothetical protein EAZ89_00285, partial [Bacteroidetes bacterium]
VKWKGQELVCQINYYQLRHIDTLGTLLHIWSPAIWIKDWWANDTVLVTATPDSISLWHLPGLTLWKSFDVTDQIEDQGNVVLTSDNYLSVVGAYSTEGPLAKIFFSTSSNVHSIEIKSGKIRTVWEQFDCIILEKGLDMSHNNVHVAASISEMLKGRKEQHGLVVMTEHGYDREWIMLPK